jgi:hypothetical protein
MSALKEKRKETRKQGNKKKGKKNTTQRGCEERHTRIVVLAALAQKVTE